MNTSERLETLTKLDKHVTKLFTAQTRVHSLTNNFGGFDYVLPDNSRVRTTSDDETVIVYVLDETLLPKLRVQFTWVDEFLPLIAVFISDLLKVADNDDN